MKSRNYVYRMIAAVVVLVLSFALFTGCSESSSSVSSEDWSSAESRSSVIVEPISEESLFNSTVSVYSGSGNYGMGFAYTDGYIVTCYHIIYDSEEIEVETYRHEKYPARLVGYDSDSDMAVLSIDPALEPLAIGDPDSLKEGDVLMVIGNPDGISSFARSEGKVFSHDTELVGKIDPEKQYIWTDVDAVTGYSGGPVFDSSRKLVGIQEVKYIGDLSELDITSLCGMIPINRVKPVIDGIISGSLPQD